MLLKLMKRSRSMHCNIISTITLRFAVYNILADEHCAVHAKGEKKIK